VSYRVLASDSRWIQRHEPELFAPRPVWVHPPVGLDNRQEIV